jgi:hypothetical protein
MEAEWLIASARIAAPSTSIGRRGRSGCVRDGLDLPSMATNLRVSGVVRHATVRVHGWQESNVDLHCAVMARR